MNCPHCDRTDEHRHHSTSDPGYPLPTQPPTRRYMCDHCAREVDVLEGPPELGAAGPFVCNEPIDRSNWKTINPHPTLVRTRSDGVLICVGTLHPIDEFSQ